jgi:hypothetical protein
MEQVALSVSLEVGWGDRKPRLIVRMDDQGTLISILHAPDEGLRQRMMAIARPLLAALEKLPETQPRMDDLIDETPF